MPKLLISLFLIVLPIGAYSNSVQQLQTELNQNKYSRAATTGLALLRQQPKNTQVLFLTALAFQHNNQPKQAQRYYQQIIQRHPELPEPRNNLAIIYLQQGKHDEAVDLLIESLNTHPAYATAWQNLSNLYKGLASEAYRKALSEENNASSVLDSIQLTALTSLHSYPDSSVEPAKPTAAIQLAKSDASDNKAVTHTPQQQNDQDSILQLEKALIQAVTDWAAHWSNKRFDDYTNAYTHNYKGNKANHKAWADYRRSRINRPGTLKVTLSNIHIKSHNDAHAIVDFDQHYQSPTYRDKIRKRINLTKTDKGWKISRERTLAVL